MATTEAAGRTWAGAAGDRLRRLSTAGLAARATVALAIAAAVFLFPLLLADFQANNATRAVIYAVIGLSMNILTGHAGQISLGHQAFVGVGAFASGYLATEMGANFYVALFVAGLVGALSAALLGLVALRLRGLYLALLTLAYGAVAEESIFGIRALTRGGEGMPAARPAGFVGDRAYLYLCLFVLALVVAADWRLMKSKAGRAIVAIRHDERVAATMGINVTFYKVLAFVLSGFIAGVAGSLFAHWQTVVVAEDFVISVALTWVFMTVVGGLGSKAGVVIGSAFFALFPFFFDRLLSEELAEKFTTAVPLIGAGLLVLTLTLYPGGIGQQLLPLRRWLAGGRFHAPRRHRPAPGQVFDAEAEAEVLAEPPHPSGDGQPGGAEQASALLTRAAPPALAEEPEARATVGDGKVRTGKGGQTGSGGGSSRSSSRRRPPRAGSKGTGRSRRGGRSGR